MATFMVRDLMINVADARLKDKRIGNLLCTQDQPTQLTCGRLSPWMQATMITDRIQHAVDFTDEVVSRGGDPDGLPVKAIDDLAIDIGRRMIGGALLQGQVAQPDPTCDGTSLEGIPSPLTPVVSKGELLDIRDLPVIKQQMQEALSKIEELEAGFSPRTALEKELVSERLKGALEEL